MAEEELKFEVALQQLESIVAKLESGELSLEESMAAFERGTKLCKQCNAKLAEAEKKIEQLTKVANEQPEWSDVPPPQG